MSMGDILMPVTLLLDTMSLVFARRRRNRCSHPWHRSLFPTGPCPSCGALARDSGDDDADWDWAPEPVRRSGSPPRSHPDADSDHGGDADAHGSSGSWCDDGDGDPGCDLEFD